MYSHEYTYTLYSPSVQMCRTPYSSVSHLGIHCIVMNTCIHCIVMNTCIHCIVPPARCVGPQSAVSLCLSSQLISGNKENEEIWLNDWESRHCFIATSHSSSPSCIVLLQLPSREPPAGHVGVLLQLPPHIVPPVLFYCNFPLGYPPGLLMFY